MTPRPTYPRPDGNQKQVLAELRAAGCCCIVTAKLAGNEKENPLDVLVIAPDFSRAVLVELKTGPRAGFKPHQEKFLRLAGVWESRFQARRDKCVMAAWTAGQILDSLGVKC